MFIQFSILVGDNRYNNRRVENSCTDDLNILNSLLNDTKRVAQVLEQVTDTVGLKNNGEKR